jgi:exodeoxyribonuclease VII large subunit
MLHALRRRWPLAVAVLVPVRVQGEGAAGEIAAAVDRLSRWGGADLVIVGRGGGSAEDLWAFNEERVARAIAACRVPVIAAVGHEIDVTIADLVADRRAATPSAAVEIAVPEVAVLRQSLRQCGLRLRRLVDATIQERRVRLRRIAAAYGFRRPGEFLAREKSRILTLRDRLLRAEARHRLVRTDRVRGLERALAALDPTSVLARGYCLAWDAASGSMLTVAAGLGSDQRIVVQFHADRAVARVEKVEIGGPLDGRLGAKETS